MISKPSHLYHKDEEHTWYLSYFCPQTIFLHKKRSKSRQTWFWNLAPPSEGWEGSEWFGKEAKGPHFWLNVYVARFPVFEPRLRQDRPFRWLDLDISSTFKNKKLKIRDNDEVDQLAITVSTLWPSQSSSSGALECTHPSTFQKLKNFWNVVVYWKWCRFWQ